MDCGRGLASENETKRTLTHIHSTKHPHTHATHTHVTLISPPTHNRSPPTHTEGRTLALHGNSSNDEDADEGTGNRSGKWVRGLRAYLGRHKRSCFLGVTPRLSLRCRRIPIRHPQDTNTQIHNRTHMNTRERQTHKASPASDQPSGKLSLPVCEGWTNPNSGGRGPVPFM